MRNIFEGEFKVNLKNKNIPGDAVSIRETKNRTAKCSLQEGSR